MKLASKPKLIIYTSIPFQNAQNHFSKSKTLQDMSNIRFELEKEHILPRAAQNSANMNSYLSILACCLLWEWSCCLGCSAGCWAESVFLLLTPGLGQVT